MEFIGTQFSLTLGSWRLRLSFALEETEERPAPQRAVPHNVRVVPMHDRVHR